MHLRARHRLRIALVVILSLLFQQLAIAAYACTTPCTPFDLVAMEGCADMGMGMAKETSTLCAKYCSPDKVVTADTVVPTVPALALPPVKYAPVLVPPPENAALATEVPIERSDPPAHPHNCSLLI
jgi:hypothetical protein